MIANVNRPSRWNSVGYPVRDSLIMKRTLRTPPMHHIVIHQVRKRHYQWLNQFAAWKPAILRHLRTIGQGVFFVLCLMTITIWTRSWKVSDSFVLMDDNARVYALIGSVDGRLYLDVYTYYSDQNQPAHWSWLTHRSDSRAYVVARHQTLDRGGPLAPYGWRILETKHWADARSRILCIPYWGFLLPSAVVMIWHGYGRWWLRRLQRRLDGGLCIKCGYDVHSCTDICPNCGTSIQKTLALPELQIEPADCYKPVMT